MSNGSKRLRSNFVGTALRAMIRREKKLNSYNALFDFYLKSNNLNHDIRLKLERIIGELKKSKGIADDAFLDGDDYEKLSIKFINKIYYKRKKNNIKEKIKLS